MKAIYLLIALAVFVAASIFVSSVRGNPLLPPAYAPESDDESDVGGDAIPAADADVGNANPPPDRFQPAERPPDNWSQIDNPEAAVSSPPSPYDFKYPGGRLGRR